MNRKLPRWLLSLTSTKGILLIVLFTATILFRIQLWDFYDNHIVEGILSTIKSHWLVDITIVLLLFLATTITFANIYNNKRLSLTTFVICMFLFIVFIYCRIFSEEYTYESFHWFKNFYYVDFTFILFFGIFLISIFNLVVRNKAPLYCDSAFLVDKPIQYPSQDKFGRKQFAEEISKKIQSKLAIEDAGALAIGINGPWGSGKTSFANIIKQKINVTNRIIIDFNPWRSSSSSLIIEDFFHLLVSELKSHDPHLSNEISDYAKTLTQINDNSITKTTKVISEILFKPESKNKIYDSINDSIRGIKKQIIIFIDDLDRLDKKEIIEILRIIRNTANFDNVVYVVSYDKGYVQTAVRDFNEHNYKSFLEKIFQFEFTLPLYEQSVLRTEIKTLLKKQMDPKFHKQIEHVVDSSEFGVNFTNEIIKTYRDVIRFVNSLLFEIETVKDEILFYDFYLLQLLKLKFPRVYEALIENRYVFFKVGGEDGTYTFKDENEAWTSDDVLSFSRLFETNAQNQFQNQGAKSESSFQKYINETQDALDLTEYDKNLIKYLLEALLKLKRTKESGEDKDLYKSFAYPNNFHKYFAFRLYEGDISAKEFEKFRREDFDAYKQKTLEWIQEGKYSAIIDRLSKVQDFSTINEFENHIKIQLELGRIQIKGNNPYWLDYSQIVKNLQYPIESKSIRLYEKEDDYAKFIRNLFTQAPEPPIYESHLIARLIGGMSSGTIEFVLSSDELSTINLNFFRQYCESHKEITPEFRQLHSNSIEANNDGHGSSYRIIGSAEVMFLNYFKKFLNACELAGFIRQTSPGYDFFYIDKEWLFRIFDNWTNFEDYLNSSESIKKDVKCYEEFRAFYDKTKGSDYSPIEFHFEHLRPTKFS